MMNLNWFVGDVLFGFLQMGDEIAARGVGIDPTNAKEFKMENVKKLWQQAHNSRSELKRMTMDNAYKDETAKINNEINK